MAHHPEDPRSRPLLAPLVSAGGPTSRRSAHATSADIRAQVKATRAQIDEANVKIQAKTGRNLPLAILIGLALGGSMLVSLLVVKSLFMIVAAVLVGFTAFELARPCATPAGTCRAGPPSSPPWHASPPRSTLATRANGWSPSAASCSSRCGVLAELVRPEPSRHRPRGVGGHRRRHLRAGLRALPRQLRRAAHRASRRAVVDPGVPHRGRRRRHRRLCRPGMSFGKHKMAPRISPKKTWEGFAGSAAAGLIAAVLLSRLHAAAAAVVRARVRRHDRIHRHRRRPRWSRSSNATSASRTSAPGCPDTAGSSIGWTPSCRAPLAAYILFLIFA